MKAKSRVCLMSVCVFLFPLSPVPEGWEPSIVIMDGIVVWKNVYFSHIFKIMATSFMIRTAATADLPDDTIAIERMGCCITLLN